MDIRASVEIEKPRMRGLPDVVAVLGFLPLVVVLLVNVREEARSVAALYGVCLLGLFAVSASYHWLSWSTRALVWWRRADHSMIYIFIAASYTPTTLFVLEGTPSMIVLVFTWGGAAAGVLKSFFWVNAPRGVTVAIYLALGWCITPWAPTIAVLVDNTTIAWFAGGGILYSLGSLVYATRTPNPWPNTFGYHEVMHLFIIAAACTHYVAQWRLMAELS